MRGRPDLETIRKWIKICSVILVILMLRVWVNVQAQRLERQLKVMRTEADRLTYENGRLQMQIYQYEAPSNLEAIAKNNYSMVPLDPSHRVGIQP
jgi:cell division protein FtsL